MKTEYRLMLTSTFDTAAERDKAYDSLKISINDTVSQAALFKRADISRDEYLVPDGSSLSERII